MLSIFKKEEIEEAVEKLVESICEICGVKYCKDYVEMWTADDPATPEDGKHVIRVTLSFCEDDVDYEILNVK